MIGPEGQGLAFVLTTPRTGSTLLGAILGSHSAIHCPPEPWFLLPLLGLRDERPLGVAAHDHDLARQATRDFLDDDLLLDGAREFARSVYGAHLQRAGKRIFVDKGTRYFHIASRLSSLFPKAVTIWLRRNPLDVIASYKTTWRIQPSALFGAQIIPATFDVTLGFQTLSEHVVPSSQAVSIRYEDLVDHPDAVVPELCAALGIEMESDMLHPFDNAELMRSYAASTFGDKKIHKASAIHTKSVGAWRSSLSPDEVELALRAMGRHLFTGLGYEDVLEEAISYASIEPSQVTEFGRLKEYQQAITTYPGKLVAVEQSVLDQIDAKEEEIRQVAAEARARLDQLTAEAAANADLQSQLKEKEQLIDKLAYQRERLTLQIQGRRPSAVARRQATQVAELDETPEPHGLLAGHLYQFRTHTDGTQFRYEPLLPNSSHNWGWLVPVDSGPKLFISARGLIQDGPAHLWGTVTDLLDLGSANSS